MNYIVNHSKDAFFNMAFEEYCLRHVKEVPFFYVWQNKPSIILGCNQDAYKEADLNYCKKNDIDVVRRCTGGGMVYHDLGNVNYSIISREDSEEGKQMIIAALESMGLKDIHSKGRNDIYHGANKISGTATKVAGDRCLFHGTLLYDLDLSQIEKVSNPNFGKIQRKSVNSNPTSVENLKDALIPAVANVDELMERLTSFLVEKNGKEIILSDDALKDIESLANTKYRNKEWIFGLPEDCDIVIEMYIEAGQVITCIKLDGNKISKIIFKGDFLGNNDVAELAELLKGVEYTKGQILNTLNTIDISSYFMNTDSCEALSLIIE